ncbi:MAG: thiamine phosphate synthase [Thermodesulfovibrio sp.]|nr:thiamine phosphate synthase [Thermodesulfovibrio sp.]
MKNFKLPSICLIVSHKEIPKKTEEALKAGVRWIQYREKELSRRETLYYSYKVRELTEKYNALLTINDYLDIAILVESQGLHLGQEDLPVEVAKKFFSGLIGLSTHDLKEAEEAVVKKADYIGFGPIFFTTTKKDALEPRGIDMLSLILKKVKIPVVAIGGIQKENLDELKNIGCKHIAVASGILEGDVIKNVEFFLKFFN